MSLNNFKEKTKISDRNALATIMGNIKQESRFISNICEGGARVPYDRCHRGGTDSSSGLLRTVIVG